MQQAESPAGSICVSQQRVGHYNNLYTGFSILQRTTYGRILQIGRTVLARVAGEIAGV